MLSNTKLTVEQKELFKDMLADYPHIQFATDFDSMVCAYFQDGKVVRFAFSVKSANEKKFRLKVGKFNAMQKVLPEWDNENTILPEYEFFVMLDSIGMEVLEFKSV
jgi:hypothetical protein